MARVEMTPGWGDKLDHEVSKYVEKLAKEVHADMVATVPRDSGRLANDLDWEVNGTTARIGAKTVPYAYYVEVGTRPHTITPNSAGALNWAGAEHPMNSVDHPGTVGTHFMRKALYKAR